MQRSSNSKEFTISGDSASVLQSIKSNLISGGLKLRDTQNETLYFTYPSVMFSSKRPLTCISHLSLKATQNAQSVTVSVGTSFTKIKLYTITIITILCFVLPGFFSYVDHGIMELSPISYIGIPIGIMLHYHVKWRVFTTLKRLIYQAGE